MSGKIDKKYLLFMQTILVLFCGIWYSAYKNSINASFRPENYEKYLEAGLYGPIDSLEDIVSNPPHSYTDDRDLSQKVEAVVGGAVYRPGVYQLQQHQTIGDAVRMAGGFQEDADTDRISADIPLYYDVTIYVPRLEEKFEGNTVKYENIPY